MPMPTRRARSAAGSPWEGALAAIMAALQGGTEVYQGAQAREREQARQQKLDERQATIDARAEEEHRLRMEDAAARRGERDRSSVNELLTNIGRGGTVAPDLASRARGNDLGHRVEDVPDFEHSYFAQAGPIPMMVPQVATRVAPTPAERQADQVAADKKRAAAAAQAALEEAIGGLPEHLRPVASFGSASGKMPTLGAADFVSPEDRQQREIAAAVEKEKALLPIKLREREALEGIQRKYATMPVPTRDDPSLPQGVRSYLGTLVAKYQSDPAGARAELQRAAPELLQAHPNLDLAKIAQQMNAMLPLPKENDSILGDAPAAAPGQPAPAAVPAKGPVPLAKPATTPDARASSARALMQQIQQGRAKGQDTTALEQQLLALKRGPGAAAVH